MNETKCRKAYNVSAISIVINILLSAVKLLAGIFANSGAMISDALHSASDVFSTIIVMIGVAVSGKKSDKGHQYGHERMECVASMILAIVLGMTGIGIGKEALKIILKGQTELLQIPGMFAFFTAVLSVLVKEWMFWYTRSAAKEIQSGALMADAWHHRSDALSSLGAMIGIWGARMGYPILDTVASLVICIFVLKAAVDIFKDAMDKMVDKSCPYEIEEQMRAVIGAQAGVLRIDELKTRLFGDKIYVDVEFSADGEKTLSESHAIAEAVHAVIEKEFPQVKHCMVHVNPYE